METLKNCLIKRVKNREISLQKKRIIFVGIAIILLSIGGIYSNPTQWIFSIVIVITSVLILFSKKISIFFLRDYSPLEKELKKEAKIFRQVLMGDVNLPFDAMRSQYAKEKLEWNQETLKKLDTFLGIQSEG